MSIEPPGNQYRITNKSLPSQNRLTETFRLSFCELDALEVVPDEFDNRRCLVSFVEHPGCSFGTNLPIVTLVTFDHGFALIRLPANTIHNIFVLSVLLSSLIWDRLCCCFQDLCRWLLGSPTLPRCGHANVKYNQKQQTRHETSTMLLSRC